MLTQIVEVGVTELKPASYNPRKWEPTETKNLKESIRRFGMVDPIIANSSEARKNVVIGGHFRLKCATELGYTTVPVVYVSIPEIEKEKELNLRLNRNLGAWDYQVLAEFDEALLQDIGFDGHEIDKIFHSIIEDDSFDVESELEKVEEPKSKAGEIYELGKHRLMCGDSTNKADVEKLMAGAQADMVFTDPPYGVNYEGKTKEKLKIQNDVGTGIFDLAIQNFITKPGATFYVCCPAGNNYLSFEIAFRKVCTFSQTLIWVKDSMVLGHGDYHYKHEPILYGWEKSGTHRFLGDRKQTSVWEIARPKVSKEHPTMKPLELINKALLNSSLNDELVVDLFGGSGSTLIACEQANRRCYTMELDPKYCDVIRNRYEIWQRNHGRAL